MANPLSVVTLLERRTMGEIVDLGLEVATAFGLPVTSWRVGDPTRSYYSYLGTVLDALELMGYNLAKSAFLSTALTDWLHLIAKEVYDVDVVYARPSTPTVTFNNTQAALHTIGVGELRVKSTETGHTFTNDSLLTIEPLEEGVVVEFTAENPGLASSVEADQIDEIVTTFVGLEIEESTASQGSDTQSNESIIEQCRASLAALSPFGPRDVFEYVARNSELTGVLDVNRANSTQDATTGDVTVYLASTDGPVASASLTAVQAALLEHAAPWCLTPTAAQSTFVPINVTATLDPLPSGAGAAFESAYGAILAVTLHGSLISRSKIIHELHKAFPTVETLILTSPAADVQLEEDEVPSMGTVSLTAP